MAAALAMGVFVSVPAAAQRANGIVGAQATTGSLRVLKNVVNTLGVASPATFAMTAGCTSYAGMASSYPLSVGPGPGYMITAVATNSACGVAEMPLASIGHVPGCKGGSASWKTSMSPATPVMIAAGVTSTITVTNTLACDPAAGGHLTVRKVVVNTLGVPTPSPFHVVAHCSAPGLLNAPLSIGAGQGVSLPGSIAANSTCTVTEAALPPIANVKACDGGSASWTAAYSPAVTIVAGATANLTVTNTLACDKPVNKGSLRVIKSVSNATTGPAPMPATFAMTVNCTPAGPSNQAIAVAPGAVGTTIGGIAAPSQCSVTESALAQIAHAEGCKGGSASWSTVYSPVQPVAITAGGTTTVTIRNTLSCDKPASTTCQKYTPSMTACRLAVVIARAKGPNTYTVTATPAAITPSMNTMPSSSASCVNAGATTVYQTNCGFFYNTFPTSVTLVASSSSGALPAGFAWSGACGGSSATCVVNVTPASLSVLANFP